MREEAAVFGGDERIDERLRDLRERHDLAALGIPSMADYVDAYVARTGLDPRGHLNAYLAYNFFRIAAILQGIAGRVRDGTATNEHAPAKAQMVRPLAETAWRFAREAGAR